MRFLLTGFEPFDQLTTNPSQQIVERLKSWDWEPEIETRLEVLPTEYERAGQRITELMREFRPHVLLSLGVATKREQITLERVALNLDDASIADNSGELRQSLPIAIDGPKAYFTAYPLESLAEVLCQKYQHVKISNHAGTYVCNHVFYVASHLAHQVFPQTWCGFLHVPLPTDSEATRHFDLDQLVDVVTDAIQHLYESYAARG